MKRDPSEFGGGRRRPYSASGIKRLLCSRAGCGRKAHATWGACADDNVQRPLCPECDFELNARVLVWLGDPDLVGKLAEYRARLEAEIGRPLENHYDNGGMLAPAASVVVNLTGEPERFIPAS